METLFGHDFLKRTKLAAHPAGQRPHIVCPGKDTSSGKGSWGHSRRVATLSAAYQEPKRKKTAAEERPMIPRRGKCDSSTRVPLFHRSSSNRNSRKFTSSIMHSLGPMQ